MFSEDAIHAPERIGEEVWLVEGDIVSFYGFPYPTRSVIIRLAGDRLWIWSPVALTDYLRLAVEDLGHPTHLVSPNKIHHLFLKDWKESWPNARLWGPASTIAKRKDLTFEPALDEVVPKCWGDDIDMFRVAGSVFMDEIVFFHRPSCTVILADLIEAFNAAFLKAHWSPMCRCLAPLWGITEEKAKAPLEWRLSFLNRPQARAARDKILSWPAEQVVMAHGVWQRHDGRAFLERSLSWLD